MYMFEQVKNPSDLSLTYVLKMKITYFAEYTSSFLEKFFAI